MVEMFSYWCMWGITCLFLFTVWFSFITGILDSWICHITGGDFKGIMTDKFECLFSFNLSCEGKKSLEGFYIVGWFVSIPYVIWSFISDFTLVDKTSEMLQTINPYVAPYLVLGVILLLSTKIARKGYKFLKKVNTVVNNKEEK